MKKILAGALAALIMTGLAFAEETKVEFENKISSDIVNIKENENEFAGIKEQVTAEVETEKVNVGVSLITNLNKTDNDSLELTSYEFDKAYAEFKPIDALSVDFNKKVFTEGSYLPIEDDNVGNGNIGSDFSLVVRPYEGLSLAAGAKIPAVFDEDNSKKFDLDAGIDYTTDLFSIGATLRSPRRDLGFGIFVSFKRIDGLTFNAGCAYNDQFCDVKGNLLTVGAVYEFSIFTLGLDLVTNFGDEGRDLHTALCLETAVNDHVIIETQGTVNQDFDDTSKAEVIGELGAAFVGGYHKIRGGVAVSFAEEVKVYFPVYYKYKF